MGRVNEIGQIVKAKKTIAAFAMFFLLAAYPANGQTSASSAKAPRKNVQANARLKNLKKFVNRLAQALTADDYEKLADLLFIPKDFETAEADEEERKKNIVLVGQMIEQTKKAGMKFDIQMKPPGKIIAVEGKLFSVVAHQTTIVVDKNAGVRDGRGQLIPGGKYESSGYALAVSKDGGESWRFWNEVPKENLDREFPEATGEIKLPELKKPYFLR